MDTIHIKSDEICPRKETWSSCDVLLSDTRDTRDTETKHEPYVFQVLTPLQILCTIPLWRLRWHLSGCYLVELAFCLLISNQQILRMNKKKQENTESVHCPLVFDFKKVW